MRRTLITSVEMAAPSGGRPQSGTHAFRGIRWFHIPVSVGIGVLAFVQIRRMVKDGRRHRDRSGPTAWQVRSKGCVDQCVHKARI